MRWVAMLLLGMAIGALGAVTVVGALRQETPLRKAVMAASSQQLRQLRAEQAAGRCGATGDRLVTLRTLAGEFEAAFLPNGRDELFRRHLGAYEAALERARGVACPALATALRDVGRACKACHDDFRAP